MCRVRGSLTRGSLRRCCARCPVNAGVGGTATDPLPSRPVREIDATPTAKGVALGLLAGVMSGLFGIGGGAVLVPLLVLWLALPQHSAHATSLAAIILTAASGTLAFAREGSVNFGAGTGIAAGAIAGAYFGAALMHRLSPARLRQAFAVLMVVVALQMLIGFTPDDGVVTLGGAGAVAGYVLYGVVAGGLSALIGVGGGVIMVPAMVLLFGFTQHVAEGTSLLIIIPTAVVGAVRHSRHGYTDWRLGLALGAGGIVGAIPGAAVALRLDAEVLQRLFAIFLLLTSAHLLWTARPQTMDHIPGEIT
ncbi:MAG: TSUP family transporter [Nitriliruptorales bacterium]|nr:TSUP family transporter [Nitriliruptorales bacterium]